MGISRDRLVRLINASLDYQQALRQLLNSNTTAHRDNIPAQIYTELELLQHPDSTIITIAEETARIKFGKGRPHYTEEVASEQPPDIPEIDEESLLIAHQAGFSSFSEFAEHALLKSSITEKEEEK